MASLIFDESAASNKGQKTSQRIVERCVLKYITRTVIETLGAIEVRIQVEQE
jgi:hypothetical protein